MTVRTGQLDVDALLVLYLAEELSADQRLALEARLAADAGLRGRLDEMRALHDLTYSGLDALDAGNVAESESLIQRTVREMKRQMTRDAVRPAAVEPGPRRIAWWHPWAAAAAILIGLLGYWGMKPDTNTMTLNAPPMTGPAERVDTRLALARQILSDSLATPESDNLDAAESHLAALKDPLAIDFERP